ncbi:MAG: NAD-dependent malic enzyme [Deltaproteobacteria bacterium]|nr:NAD-dependent malic enzyme [Deltaproteobacteria bacterium]
MIFTIKKDVKTGQKYMGVTEKGAALLTDPWTNKGTAFTNEERDRLGLHGLLPPHVSTMEEQLQRSYESFLQCQTPLEKNINLTSLQDRNRTLFYRLLVEHIDEMMPIVYTPTIGDVCQKFSFIYRKPRGLYVSYDHINQLEKVLSNYPCKDPTIMVVTDGERILGLGDQGVGGIGISMGKLCLYSLCAGVPPYDTMPVVLDVGTDNQTRLETPLYLGLRRKRIRGEDYQLFIDKFIEAVQKIYPNILVQWEDFLKGNAIKQLHRFKDKLCTFNDDIQGTASVVLAGILSGLKITKQSLQDQRLVIAGAGASAQGIAELFTSALVNCGLSQTDAIKRIWMTDSRGLVTKERSNLEDFKATYARDVSELESYKCADRSQISLRETILNVRPTILLGSSGTPGLFTKVVVEAMAKVNERPMVFPLSNPTANSECTAEDAINWSEGRAIVATGSPFKPVNYKGREHHIGQCNNAYIFPGVGLGIISCKARRVTNIMFYEAAKALSDTVTEAELKSGTVFPSLSRIRDCSHKVACAVVRQTAEGRQIKDIEQTVRDTMWNPDYLPVRYEP